MRRILVIIIALAVAIACNVVLLLVAVISDAVTGGAIVKLLAGLFDEGMALGQGEIDIDGAALAGLLSLIWHAMAALCVLPLTLTALLAEAARSRSLIWHMLAPGVIAAAVPWMLRFAFVRPGVRDAAQTPVENRFLALFFICAALSGAVYWLISRRRIPNPQR
ncbi:hypothetical protein PY365_21745 [Roseiarcaceae bacterium H3SJ34-1]|uniref:hypothetical protein n=1 Tax=Terripilifer ovatus TaxID=3032367 RepID=UPI003AB9564B|nr:hypothetical protein [Roseiarcaceae bacterium H3SJ34-1]